MRKKKRKYTRHTGSSSGKTEAFGASDNGSIPLPVANSRNGVATFEDLPKYIKDEVLKSINYRKRLNLFDDSEDRKARALRYYRENYGRKTSYI